MVGIQHNNEEEEDESAEIIINRGKAQAYVDAAADPRIRESTGSRIS
jgi:hypothetical protein